MWVIQTVTPACHLYEQTDPWHPTAETLEINFSLVDTRLLQYTRVRVVHRGFLSEI